MCGCVGFSDELIFSTVDMASSTCRAGDGRSERTGGKRQGVTESHRGGRTWLTNIIDRPIDHHVSYRAELLIILCTHNGTLMT